MPMRMGMARVIASMSIGISYLVGGPSWGVGPEKAPGDAGAILETRSRRVGD